MSGAEQPKPARRRPGPKRKGAPPGVDVPQRRKSGRWLSYEADPDNVLSRPTNHPVKDEPLLEKLSSRQRAFVMAYLSGKTIQDSYNLAGYSPPDPSGRHAHVLMRHPNVAEAIRQGLAETPRRIGLHRGWVLERLKEIAERSMQAVPVQDGDGDAVGVYKFDAAAANKALELLGRDLMMFGTAVRDTDGDNGSDSGAKSVTFNIVLPSGPPPDPVEDDAEAVEAEYLPPDES